MRLNGVWNAMNRIRISIQFNSIQFNSINKRVLRVEFQQWTTTTNKKIWKQKRSHGIYISKFNWITSVISQIATFNYTFRICIGRALASGHQSTVCWILNYIWEIPSRWKNKQTKRMNQSICEFEVRNAFDIQYYWLFKFQLFATYDSDLLLCNSWFFDFCIAKPWSMPRLWWLEQL